MKSIEEMAQESGCVIRLRENGFPLEWIFSRAELERFVAYHATLIRADAMEQAAQIAEKHSRWVNGVLEGNPAPPCPVAAAIRSAKQSEESPKGGE